MIRPTDLTDRQQRGSVRRPSFDINEPEELAPVAEPGDEDSTENDYPLQHAEREEDQDVGS